MTTRIEFMRALHMDIVRTPTKASSHKYLISLFIESRCKEIALTKYQALAYETRRPQCAPLEVCPHIWRRRELALHLKQFLNI